MELCPNWTEFYIIMLIKLHLETITWIDIIIGSNQDACEKSLQCVLLWSEDG